MNWCQLDIKHIGLHIHKTNFCVGLVSYFHPPTTGINCHTNWILNDVIQHLDQVLTIIGPQIDIKVPAGAAVHVERTYCLHWYLTVVSGTCQCLHWHVTVASGTCQCLYWHMTVTVLLIVVGSVSWQLHWVSFYFFNIS